MANILIADDEALLRSYLREVLEGVATRAGSELGRQAVLSLRPGADAGLVELELDRVDELLVFLEDAREFQPPEIPDARSSLERRWYSASIASMSPRPPIAAKPRSPVR